MAGCADPVPCRRVNTQRIVGGRYRLEEHLGSGGMGTVWRATDDLLGRTVAVKQLSPGPGAPPAWRERAVREARATAALDHPHIVRVYDVVSDEDHVWI